MSSRRERTTHRLRQGLHALKLADTLPTPASLPGERIVHLFESLSARDRHHLVTVYQAARKRTGDTNFHLAALLHDLGKVTLSGQQISLPARTFAVLATLLPRRVRDRLRPERDGAWLTGPWLAEHHARLGADRLRALGVSEAVCQLVEHHDSHDFADERLCLLREIDSTTL
jgi:hypothetical protein